MQKLKNVWMRLRAAFHALRNPGLVVDGIGLRNLTAHLYRTGGIIVAQAQITKDAEIKLHTVELNSAQRALIRNTIPSLNVRK